MVELVPIEFEFVYQSNQPEQRRCGGGIMRVVVMGGNHFRFLTVESFDEKRLARRIQRADRLNEEE